VAAQGHETLLFATLERLRAVATEARACHREAQLAWHSSARPRWQAEIPLADLATAWPLANPAVTCVIAGATKLPQARGEHRASRGTAFAHALCASQVEKNARAVQLGLDPVLAAKLNKASEELKAAMGGNCDLWQGLHSDGKFDGRIK
jgi:hypothetical protein